MSLSILIAGALLLGAGQLGADEGIPPAVGDAWQSTCLVVAGTSQGSCFALGSDVVTAAHVIGRSDTVTVVFAGEASSARVAVLDERRDVAILTPSSPAPTDFLTSVQTPQRGQSLYVLGFPGGRQETAAGTVLGFQRLGGQRYLRTDASLAPGNSGGPVVTSDGRLMGMAVANERDFPYVGLVVPIDDLGVTASAFRPPPSADSLGPRTTVVALAALGAVALVTAAAATAARRHRSNGSSPSALPRLVIEWEDLGPPRERV